MIARSPAIKVVCTMLSGTLLLGASQFAATAPKVEVEGAGQAMQARIGSSFQDMTAGTLEAQNTPNETAQTVPLDQTSSIKAEQATNPAQIAETTPQTLPAETIPSVVTTAPITVAPTQSTAQPVTAALQPTTQIETLSSSTPDSAAPALARRPRLRDPDTAAKVAAARPKAAKPKPRSIQSKAPKPAAQAGNAKRNNTQGAEAGSQTAKARTQGTSRKKASQSGNAAASNYPGQVMRRLSRVPKPRVNNRGTAVIAFSISSGGGLASASVARSSGSARLDQAALRVVRKAAPFPRPPSGAKRRFSVRIKGR